MKCKYCKDVIYSCDKCEKEFRKGDKIFHTEKEGKYRFWYSPAFPAEFLFEMLGWYDPYIHYTIKPHFCSMECVKEYYEEKPDKIVRTLIIENWSDKPLQVSSTFPHWTDDMTKIFLLIAVAFLPAITVFNNTILIPAIQPYINLPLTPLFIFILSVCQSLVIPFVVITPEPLGWGDCP